MQNDLSYETPEGFTIFTAQYLKNRGTCCKSACLHCPYGFTLKKHGLTFHLLTDSDHLVVEEILRENDLTDLEWKSFLPENIQLIKLKDVVCGFMLKNHIVVKKLILKPKFQHQELSRELVESYFFI